jgi:hypothetical protein
MGWERLDIATTEKNRLGVNSVRLLVNKRALSHDKRPYCCRITMAAAVLDALSWPNPTSVNFFWGNGCDRGKLRLIPVTGESKGLLVRPQKTTSGTVISRHLPKDADTSEEICSDVDYTIAPLAVPTAAKCLEIELPPAFYRSAPPVSVLLSSCEQPAVAPPPPVKSAAASVLMQPPAVAGVVEITPIAPPTALKPVVRTKPQTPPTPKLVTPPPRATERSYDGYDRSTTAGSISAPPAMRLRSDETRVDISGVCRYIRTEMGEQATVSDARSVYINDKLYSHPEALTFANVGRLVRHQPPLELRPPV